MKSAILVTARITPAHAGTTNKEALKALGCRDHPRSRGKDDRAIDSSGFIPGSPPLARERLILKCTKLYCSRITPADAGTTKGHQLQRFYTRITPAHAGKTQREVSLCFTSGEHPRSCGKDFCLPDGGLQKLFVFSGPFLDEPPDYFTAVNALVCTGSAEILPQLLRNPNVKPDFLFFFICHLASLLSYGDHPRSRGKDALANCSTKSTIGSLPLTRERQTQPNRR